MIEITKDINFNGEYKYKAFLYLQDTIELSENEHNLIVSDISQSINDANYELSNVNISFSNKNYWASIRFDSEAPLNKLVDIYLDIDTEEYKIFSGIVNSFSIEDNSIKFELLA